MLQEGGQGFSYSIKGSSLNTGGWVGKLGLGFSLVVLPLPLQVRRDTQRDRIRAARRPADVTVCVRTRVCVRARRNAHVHTDKRSKQRKESRIRTEKLIEVEREYTLGNNHDT